MMRIALVTMLSFFATNAQANLCKNSKNGGLNNPRYLAEAKAVELSQFSSAGTGDRTYDATVLRCNRDRDTLRKDIEAYNLEKDLPKNLSPRMIRGRIQYMGFFGLPYGYQLSRKNGTWHVTAVLDFDFPKAKNIYVDKVILETIGRSCNAAQHCKVGNTKTVRTAIMKTWRDEIERVWSVPGFKVDVRVKNLGEIKGKALKRFEKKDNFLRKNAIWRVKFSKKSPEKKRATYYPIPIFKTRGISSGEDSTTLVHEFGHWMGLDDEYEEFKSRAQKRQNLVCKENGGEAYMMCDMYNDDVLVRPVYAWIITRRYLANGSVNGMGKVCDRGENLGRYKKKPVCAFGVAIRESKCRRLKGHMKTMPGYCLLWDKKRKVYQARGILGKEAKCERGKNLGKHKGKLICEKAGAYTPEKCASKKGSTSIVDYYCVYPDRDLYAAKLIQCSSDVQCEGRQYCDRGFVGIGTNRCKPKKANKKVCSNGRQCLSGRCYAGICAKEDACKKDGDCRDGQYCDKGVLTVGVNQCVSKKANGKACSRKEQCTSGRCYWGKCNVKDACKKDEECSKGKYCDKGTLTFGVNTCVTKRKNGTTCSRKGQCSSGRCFWGKCNTQDACKKDSECKKGKYCDKGTLSFGVNKCKTKRSKGTKCSRKGQCKSNRCFVKCK